MAPAGMPTGSMKATGSCGCGSMGEDSVEEEYANEPDETTMDTAYMTKDLSGGLNRPKDKRALRAKDPAIHYDESIKNHLENKLQEMYSAIEEMSPEKAQSITKRLKKATGTGMGGKQHSQYDKFSKNPPKPVGPKAGIQKDLAQRKTNKAPQAKPVHAPGTPGPQAPAMSLGTSINPKTASLAAKAFPGFISKGGTAEQIVQFWTGKGVPRNQLQDFFRAKIQQNSGQ